MRACSRDLADGPVPDRPQGGIAPGEIVGPGPGGVEFLQFPHDRPPQREMPADARSLVREGGRELALEAVQSGLVRDVEGQPRETRGPGVFVRGQLQLVPDAGLGQERPGAGRAQGRGMQRHLAGKGALVGVVPGKGGGIAAEPVMLFEYQGLKSLACQQCGAAEAAKPRTDDHCVIVVRVLCGCSSPGETPVYQICCRRHGGELQKMPTIHPRLLAQ